MYCREACAALRLELTARHQEESHATRAELVSRREREVQEEKDKWTAEVERLKETVSNTVLCVLWHTEPSHQVCYYCTVDTVLCLETSHQGSKSKGGVEVVEEK